MCTDYCPCKEAEFTFGSFDKMTSDDLSSYGRYPYPTSGVTVDKQLLTDTGKNAIAPGDNSVAYKALTDASTLNTLTNPLQPLKINAVSTYQACWENVIDTAQFRAFLGDSN